MKHPIKPLLFAALAAPCALFADIDWTAYAKSIDITFPGYTGATTLTNFPVLVRLSAKRNKFDYSKCQTNGADLRFSNAEGNLLSHEIDTWNASGESLVWVKVPLFNADTMITAHYGLTSGQPPAVTASADASSERGASGRVESASTMSHSSLLPSVTATPSTRAISAPLFGPSTIFSRKLIRLFSSIRYSLLPIRYNFSLPNGWMLISALSSWNERTGSS